MALIAWSMLDQLPSNGPQQGQVITVGPYRLRLHERRHDYWLAFRETPSGRLLWLREKLFALKQKTESRIILTLAIWNLGKWPDRGAEPSWGDVARRWRK